jgi:hypothetical protein
VYEVYVAPLLRRGLAWQWQDPECKKAAFAG